MWEEQSMGSQTLEILRQGIWASITGGWFYDPSQDVFCNTAHLYIWLFLLCLPFSIYMYLPPNKFVWYMYCSTVALALATVKFTNYFLHHIYDTKECEQEVVMENGEKREEEGIELQDMALKEDSDRVIEDITNRSRTQFLQILTNKLLENAEDQPSGTLNTYKLLSELRVLPSTDSLESSEFQQVETAGGNGKKVPSTIDLKVDVHRKNSSESSEAGIVSSNEHKPRQKSQSCRKSDRRHHRSKTDGFVSVTIKDDSPVVVSTGKLFPQGSSEMTDHDNNLLTHHRPSSRSIESDQGASSFGESSSGRRHSNFAISSLNYLPVTAQTDIKPTGSLELGYIDKNPNQSLNSEGFYFKQKGTDGVRRFKSAALETVCPPTSSLKVHPNSLEVIGCKNAKNPLPPPSTSLVRNQHLNLCYGSEIVYPIAEQSDEHQTSHGPDTDPESLTHVSDTDSEEINQASRSPLLSAKNQSKISSSSSKAVPYHENPPNNNHHKHKKTANSTDMERASSTSKDALLDLEISNSSLVSDKIDPYATDNDVSDKKLSQGSNLSISSIESDNRRDFRLKKLAHEKGLIKKRNSEPGDSDKKMFKGGIVRKKNIKKTRRRPSNSDQLQGPTISSSLVELDLDWLFDGESNRLPLRKEPLKSEEDFNSSIPMSLEQDVSLVLKDNVASVSGSSGAIPKRPSTSRDVDKKLPKSESEKCKACSRSNSEAKTKSSKENKVTQTVPVKDSLSLEEINSTPSSSRTLKASTPSRKNFKSHTSFKNEEASSSGSNNELSTLLPAAAPPATSPATQPLLSALLTKREAPSTSYPGDSYGHFRKRRTRTGHRKRSNPVAKRDMAIASSLSAGYGTHGAKNFNDTSEGSVHCFIDEHGKYITYTFGERGNINPAQPDPVATSERSALTVPTMWGSMDSVGSSSVSTIMDVSRGRSDHSRTERPPRPRLGLARETQAIDIRNCLGTEEVPDAVSTEINGSDLIKLEDDAQMPRSHFKFIRMSTNDLNSNTKSFYKVKLLPGFFVKVTLDRLKLLALLDRNLTVSETVISVILGTVVSVLGAILLFLNVYKDIAAFVFCFIIASCQYSLLKSVQPDSASPIHGFNRLIAYSRPIYFILFGSIILILHFNISHPSQNLLILTKDFFIFFILFFPFLFSVGLFPQINTFLLYVLEQIDIHIFGGNAMCSLVASVYCVFRSLVSVIILSGLAYLALSENQDVLFSIFCACLVASCYHLSRCASDPAHVWSLIKKHMWLPDIYREESVYFSEQSVLYEKKKDELSGKSDEVVNITSDNQETRHKDDHVDPLPKQLQRTVNARLKNDVIVCSVIAIVVFAVHASTVFSVLQPELNVVLCSIACGLGLILHYIIPQLRKQLPWVCIARPIFKPDEYAKYQIREAARIMWFEKVYVYLCFFERNILYPLLVLSALTGDKPKIKHSHPNAGAFILVICGMKLLRSSYSDQNSQFLIVTFAALFFNYDYGYVIDSFLVQYFFMSIVYHKVFELLLKVQFVITYIAPWQITWGSAFHAFAQPFSVPHSAMLFLQSILSAIFSTPLTPFLGSAIFITSYVRPVKFWERDYNTRRVDHSNTPLSSHLDRNLGADDNNLNSIFYEHLTRSLQKSLFGDLAMGRWGLFNQGDIFVMASDYLNCLVHIIGIGNGFVTFQVRGLEFRGTYCQQREVEAITEGVENDEGCCCICCCNTGHLPNMLSLNAAFNQRWLAWEVTAAKYILEGYSISDNSVVSMLQVFEFRKVLISYYVKSIIFYTIRSAKLEEWLNSEVINKTLRTLLKPSFVDLDPVFNHNIDEDYDTQHNGMTRNWFLHVHGEWIQYCLEKRGSILAKKQKVVLLCFALSLLGRRTLGAVSQNMVSSVEFFLYGLHALFKGDFRITCTRDEWVFTDMDLLKTVVAPAVRMSLKLHQDHFMSPDEYEVLPTLYEAICKHEQELVISHEGDPAWRNAVLSGTPSLLALRHVFDEGTDEYKIIMLNKRYLSFRVIKVNRECVRGLWAGQQQELVYFRNRNPERGSIQNAKQALRNIINSSCDQPIGYPIYVSPLTTSYAETNEQYCSLVGGSVSIKKIRSFLFDVFRRVRKRCVEGCSSGASIRDEISGMGNEGVYAMSATLSSLNSSQPIDARVADTFGRRSVVGRNTFPGANRSSFASGGKPTSSTLVSLASLFKERDERAVSQAPDAQGRTDERLGDTVDGSDKEVVAPCRAKILDPNLVYDGINLGRRIDVTWPSEHMRTRGGRSYWNNWLPEAGMEGTIVHKWTPCHRNPNKRSHVDRTILLLQIEDKFVPIAESGCHVIETDPT